MRHLESVHPYSDSSYVSANPCFRFISMDCLALIQLFLEHSNFVVCGVCGLVGQHMGLLWGVNPYLLAQLWCYFLGASFGLAGNNLPQETEVVHNMLFVAHVDLGVSRNLSRRSFKHFSFRPSSPGSATSANFVVGCSCNPTQVIVVDRDLGCRATLGTF